MSVSTSKRKGRRVKGKRNLDTNSKNDQVLDFQVFDSVSNCRLSTGILEATRVLVGDFEDAGRTSQPSSFVRQERKEGMWAVLFRSTK
jgi:hypothetical protein